MAQLQMRSLVVGLIVAITLPLCLAPGFAVAQDAGPASPSDSAPVMQKGFYMGAASCAASGCHGSPVAVADAEILMNEYDTWLHAPAPTHVRAWEVLLQPVSKRIARNFGLSSAPESSPACIGCHSTNVPVNLQARPGAIEIADGVSCESCHGPAGGWFAGHVEEDWKHEDSVEAGMTDLRDLATRARTCLGCHMGDESNQVTHDLIAAGHPILTFELDNYSNSTLMPRHWKADPERHGVEAWAVGQVVALKQETTNLSRHVNGSEWPEFSHMSCASCHHPLREGEWRQQRGFEHRPGMPLWSADRWLVTRHLVEIAAPNQLEGLAADIDVLSGEVGRMRDREKIATLARSVQSRLDRVLAAVEDHRWTEQEIRQLIQTIADSADRYAIADRQSAEQATLSLITLVSELDRSRRGSLSETVDELYRLLDRLGHPDEYDRISFASTLRDL